jgi:hypothetical protein
MIPLSSKPAQISISRAPPRLPADIFSYPLCYGRMNVPHREPNGRAAWPIGVSPDKKGPQLPTCDSVTIHLFANYLAKVFF